MQSPANTPQKSFSLRYTLKGDAFEDVMLKDCVSNTHRISELGKTDDCSGSYAFQTPVASQTSEDQGLKSQMPASNVQTELRETTRQKRRRRRTTPQELAILEEEYLKDEKPNLLNRERIAAKINGIVMNDDKMGSREIQIWFQNKRQAMRRQSSHSVPPTTPIGIVSGLQVTKQPTRQMIDDIHLRQHIEHKISSFKRVPSLRLCTNEGGKAQVMFNVLRENKNSYALYKRNDKHENKCIPYPAGKENIPPDDHKKSIRTEACEDEMEACARSLVGLARGW